MATSPFENGNIKRFVAFRILFNARFYYPVFTIVFLDFGLTLEQFAILNAAWAASIVLLEVPSGALADTIGRRNLVVAASAIMLIEMALLCFAPIGNSTLVFYLFLVNRILSGAAEAAASGADEALAYDSLKQEGKEGQWSQVLEAQMKWQSLAFVIAMSAGAFLYDAAMINRFLAWLGADLEIAKETAMRIPLFLTLILGIGAFVTTLGMKEVSHESEEDATGHLSSGQALKEAFLKTLSAGAWILKTPAAFLIILAGLLFDHVGRMVVTLNSQYYRQIELPEASFGLISSALSMLGIVIPSFARRLAENRSKTFNFILIGVICGAGFWGMTFFIPYWGAIPMGLLYVSFFLVGFFVSHYLNEITESSMRATVLSFKGLSFNLAYGAIGIMYSYLVLYLRGGYKEAELSETQLQETLFVDAMQWFPGYFAILFVIVFLVGIFLTKKKV